MKAMQSEENWEKNGQKNSEPEIFDLFPPFQVSEKSHHRMLQGVLLDINDIKVLVQMILL